MNLKRFAFLMSAWLAHTLTCSALIEQWDFNGNLASANGGTNLVEGTSAPSVSPSFSFVNATIAGQTAQVASFSRGTFFRLTHRFPANGGGVEVNNYTLIMDVMFPSRPTGWAVLWQTNPDNTEDGEWFINPSRGLGISGVYAGTVSDGSWNRIAMVIDAATGTLTSFLNGVQVQQVGGPGVDTRWSLGGAVLLFADENQENAAGFVNSVQLRDSVLSASEIAELGGPSAAGIPLPPVPTLQLVRPNGGESFQAGSTQMLAWTASSPNGSVQLDLFRGGVFVSALGQAPMRQSNFVWLVPPRLGDSNNYQIKINSMNFPAVSDLSDGPFTVFGSGPPANASFGQPLQSNGGFEQQFAGWQTVMGHPTTLTSANGKGSPHSGTRFFHGGLNPAGNATVRQEIDLLAAGFTAAELDSGAALEAEAWLRNWFGAGTFDDQVYYRVAYLDAHGVELSSVRCLLAGNNIWLQRSLTGLLPAGTRKLGLEVVGKHRRDLDNDSMADDIVVRLQEAYLQPTPAIVKLPMLQAVRTNAMTLLWETDGNLTHHGVDWGRGSIAENSLTQIETLRIDATHFVHRATLTGLETGTSYLYRVRAGTNSAPIFSFRTAPAPETPFAVAWWGDNHAGTATLRTHVSNMLAHAPDMICVAGDMVNSGNVLSEWHDYWFKPLEHLNLAQTRPVIYARGNHDSEHALAYAYSALPGNEAWFAFDYGNSRFIFLDSEVNTSGSPEQFAWLQAELSRPETQRAAFRIVCFHRPPYVNLWNGGGHTGEGWVQTDWVPLFEQKNVDIVISGHAHNYNRGVQRGVTYVVSGGGGGTLDVERVANWPLYTVEASRYHFDLMEVIGETLNWQTFDNNNQLIDMFTLHSRVAELAWQQFTPPGGTFPLVLSGKPGTTYHIEGSTDLQAWRSVATNILSATGSGRATNVVSTFGRERFFRARALP